MFPQSGPALGVVTLELLADCVYGEEDLLNSSVGIASNWISICTEDVLYGLVGGFLLEAPDIGRSHLIQKLPLLHFFHSLCVISSRFSLRKPGLRLINSPHLIIINNLLDLLLRFSSEPLQ